MVYVLYTLLVNLVPALVKAYCWQQGQEFQNQQKSRFKGAGSSKWWFWNWSGQGQGKGSRRAAAWAAAGAGVPKPPENRFLKASGQGQGRGSSRAAAGAAAGAGFTLRAMIGSAIKKCTPDSREGSIFLIRPVLLRKFPNPGAAT